MYMKTQKLTRSQIEHMMSNLVQVTYDVADQMIQQMPEDYSWLKKRYMTSSTLLPTSKLFLLYVLENDLDEFSSAEVYSMVGIQKAHWLRFVKPELIKLGLIKEVNRTWVKYLNPAKVF